jgi:hypothetical protein
LNRAASSGSYPISEETAVLLAFLAVMATPIEETPYWHCLDTSVVKLEKSGERPRDVAAAAIEECHSAEPRDLGINLRMKIREKLIPKLAARVVEIRASRP